MLSSIKKKIVFLCCVTVCVWFVFRYALNDGGVLPVETSSRMPGTPVLVAVFYEALCPDSKHFITKQLLPAYKAAPSLLHVVLVPYGKATTSVSADGTLQFDCQHGPLECQANIYHACTVEIISDTQLQLDIISCMIKDNRMPKEALHRCAQAHHSDSTELIQKCVDTSHGSDLLKLNGDATHALRPSVSFIPTITIDGSQGKQAAILKNLMAEICKLVSDDIMANDICALDLL